MMCWCPWRVASQNILPLKNQCTSCLVVAYASPS
jgi:hypothetical protein